MTSTRPKFNMKYDYGFAFVRIIEEIIPVNVSIFGINNVYESKIISKQTKSNYSIYYFHDLSYKWFIITKEYNKIIRVRICYYNFPLSFMYKVRAAFAAFRRLRPEVVEIWFLKHFSFRNRIVCNIVNVTFVLCDYLFMHKFELCFRIYSQKIIVIS